MSEKKDKSAQKGDVWASERKRSHVQRITGEGPYRRVHYRNQKANGKLGADMSAWESVFVRGRTLVERDGKAVA